MTAALATGRLGEAADIARIRIPRNGVTWALLGLQGVLYYSLDDFSTAGDQFSAASQIDYSYELLILRHLCLLHVGQAAHSELHRWEPYNPFPDLAVDRVEDQLIRHLQGKAAESDVVATLKDSRDDVSDCSLAYFVLSALARLGDDPKKEWAYLDSCLSIGAYDSLPHLLALRRVEAVESEVLAAKMINAKP